MKRLTLPLVGLCLAASPISLSAQVPLSPEAEEALKCAMWASYFSVAFEGEEEAAALTNALTYFVGRYEGLTGQGIDEALYEELIVATANDIDALTPVCSARMEEFGNRLLDWSRLLDAIMQEVEEEPVSETVRSQLPEPREAARPPRYL